MPIDIYSDDARLFKQLVPLATIPATTFASLCEQLSVEEVEQGAFLFKEGDTHTDLFYLLSGQITLQFDALKVETIQAGSESARFALAHQIPRKIDAVANSKVRFVRLSAEQLRIAQTSQNTPYKEESSYMVNEEAEENEDNWMSAILNTPIFRMLPPTNLQRILMSLEEVNYQANEVIIEQESEGDYYYIIKKGRCLITRKPSANAKEIKLGLLGRLESFGEDSLMSGQPRNVSIIAQTDVALFRLSKDNFLNFVKQPVIKFIRFAEAQEQLARNEAIMIDVREPDEYKKHHLDNSVNVPFFTLRMQIKILDKQKPIIAVCNQGHISESAAFLLMKYRFTAFVLEGGIEAADRLLRQQAAEAKPVLPEITEENLPPADESAPSIAVPATAEALQSENQQLKQQLSQLEEKYKVLEGQKEELENRYRMLYKQTEKLKNALDALKNNNANAG